MKSKKRIIYFFILLLIIIYGIVSRWVVLDDTIFSRHIIRDATEYFSYAKNISLYSTFSLQTDADEFSLVKDSKRPPGFPLFASIFYQNDGTVSVASVLFTQFVIQCIMFLALSVLCWLLLGELTSVIISLLVWTHPAFMSINTYYLTESLFLSSLIITMILFIKSVSEKKNKLTIIYSITFGLCLGFSALVRSTMDYYVFFIIAILLFQDRKNLKKLWPAIAACLLIMFGWKVRNYFAIGSLSDQHLLINGIFHGSYPDFMYKNIPESFGFPYKYDPLEKEYYKGIGTALKLIWHRVQEQPMEYSSWYLFGKQTFLWRWSEIAGWDIFIYPVNSSPFLYQKDLQFWHYIHKNMNAVIMITGILFSYYTLLYALIKKQSVNVEFIVSSLVVYASLFHIIVAPFPRYGVPFKPFVIIMFILAVKYLFLQIKRKCIK
jgi:hypothetical protein